MNTHQPPTVIVVLNWNSRQMTAECIQSLLGMDAAVFEIVVVDSGSNDGSVAYLRTQFPQITVLPLEENLGFAVGCNVGMKWALDRGATWVLPLNNDTIVDSHFLAELERVAVGRPRAGMVSPKIYFWDQPECLWWAGGAFSLWTGIPRHIGRKKRDRGQFNSETNIDWATGCAVLIRCDALRQVGMFDGTFFGNVEDLDLSLRMRKAGFEICFAPHAKLWHKEGVDYRKNAGEYLRKYTGTRNLLLVMSKHARVLHWMTFLPNFAFRYVGFYIAISIIRRDFRSAWAAVRGIVAFLNVGRKRRRQMSKLAAGKLRTS